MEIMLTFIVIVAAVIYFNCKGSGMHGSGGRDLDYWMWHEMHDHYHKD